MTPAPPSLQRGGSRRPGRLLGFRSLAGLRPTGPAPPPGAPASLPAGLTFRHTGQSARGIDSARGTLPAPPPRRRLRRPVGRCGGIAGTPLRATILPPLCPTVSDLLFYRLARNRNAIMGVDGGAMWGRVGRGGARWLPNAARWGWEVRT